MSAIQLCSIDPGLFRQVDEMLRDLTKGKGTIDILSVKNVGEGDQLL